MSLVNPKAMLNKAKQEQKAVGAFNILSIEIMQGVIKAAEEMNTPVICQISQGAMKWAKFEYIVPMALSAAKAAKVDVAIHLDHAQEVGLVKKCIDAGFSSVMYDGSHFSLEKNIQDSNEVINYAKNKAFVEIEIGKVGGKEDDLISDANETIDVDKAVAFYNQTKPGALAIAFGTAHGVYKEKANLNFELIKECVKKIPVPLVMHGTSGVPVEDIKAAIKSGVTKVNVGTDLLISFNTAIRKYLKEYPTQFDIRKINTAGIEAVANKTKDYLKIFNT